MSDSFTQETPVTVIGIGDTETVLFDPMPGSNEAQSAHVNIQLIMSDGSVRVRRFNLANHFGATTINQLKAFVAAIRTKAEAELLPAQEI